MEHIVNALHAIVALVVDQPFAFVVILATLAAIVWRVETASRRIDAIMKEEEERNW